MLTDEFDKTMSLINEISRHLSGNRTDDEDEEDEYASVSESLPERVTEIVRDMWRDGELPAKRKKKHKISHSKNGRYGKKY